jgi:hypothetical protein
MMMDGLKTPNGEIAKNFGLTKRTTDRMDSAFEHEDLKKALRL